MNANVELGRQKAESMSALPEFELYLLAFLLFCCANVYGAENSVHLGYAASQAAGLRGATSVSVGGLGGSSGDVGLAVS